MTARQLFEGALIECSKQNAPSLLLEDYNYFANKAINIYVNKHYNVYDTNQQSTDDLRVLKATAVLSPTKAYDDTIAGATVTSIANLQGATYEVNLPSDYLHLLNCICVYKLKKTHKCYDKDSYVQFAAKRLTADSWSSIINDYYQRPKPQRPYYYIHNVNKQNELPTNVYNNSDQTGTDQVYSEDVSKATLVEATQFPKSINLKLGQSQVSQSLIEKSAGLRYANPTNVRCEIRYGKDNSVFELVEVLIDYLKAPQVIRLTQEQIDLTEDTSQVLEYPDYVCQEIINELVHLVMENTADPRLQTHIPVTQSIANPLAQAQTQQS